MFVVPGKNVPEPAEDHAAPVETLNVPASWMLELLTQTVWSDPAFTTGAGVMYTLSVDVEGLQPPLFVLPSVSVTTPAMMSALPGTNVAVSAFGVNVPVPPIHEPEPVVEVPVRTATALFAQIVLSDPARAVGGVE
jgi:hypothetical protein